MFFTHYYRRRKTVHKERIPRKRSVILAPNHQNALMDAMAFVEGINFQTVFLARADIFKKEFISRILTFMKILPIFRIRDGYNNLQKNDEIFDITVSILKNQRNPLLLFPEGNHGEYRRLRPLVKGIFRIAFKAQEHFKDKPGVIIIPSGVDYSHYSKFRQTLLINLGEPIEVCEYWKDYEENQAMGINKLRDRLSVEMKKYMIDIQTVDYYDLYMDLRSIYGPRMCRKLNLRKHNLYEKFLADKKLIAALDDCLENEPDKIEAMNVTYTGYRNIRDKLNFRNWVPRKKRYSIVSNILALILSVITWPLVLLGLFNNWPHYFLAPRIKRKIRDKQFHSTAVWGTGLVIATFYFLILIILAILFIPFWWLILIYIGTLFLTGVIALSYRKFIVKTLARIRYSWHMWRKRTQVMKMKKAFDELVEMTGSIVDTYLKED